MEVDEIKKIKEIVEELLQKITVTVLNIELKPYSVINEASGESKDFVELDIVIEEPQVLIGQNGQTLSELQRLLRIILNKKLQKDFYLTLDINDYKKKKIEYLKGLAVDLANEVSWTKEKKVLSPMPAHERRIIHMELTQREDITAESHGEGINRYIIISPR